MSGIVVLAPLFISILAVAFVLRTIVGLPLVSIIGPWFIRVPVVIFVFIMVVFATGWAMRTAVGAAGAELLTRGINQIPGIRIVYNASHLAVETALDKGLAGTKPVKVQAWKGLRVTAFTTGNRTEDGRVICFFPTAPNITTGYVIEVEESDLSPSGETIEEALTRIISAGFGDRDHDEELPPMDAARRVERVSGVTIPQPEK